MTLTGARPTEVRSPLLPAAAAVLALVTLAALVRLALHTGRGQRWDDVAMSTVAASRDARLHVLSVLGYISIGAISGVVVVCLLLALVRGRLDLAIGAVVVVAGTNLTTQALKLVVLERPDLGTGVHNSLPSGHTAVVASATAALLLVSPTLLRPVFVAIGTFATMLAGASTIIAGWHRPSDIVAALLVTLAWSSGVAAVLGGRRRHLATVAPAALGACASLAFLLMVGVRPVVGWDGAAQAGLVLGVTALASAAFVIIVARLAPADPPRDLASQPPA